MIDHVAYTVEELDEVEQDRFWTALGFFMFPIPSDDVAYAYELEQRQRWYSNRTDCDVHIVENRDEADTWNWGHLCVKVEEETYDELRHSDWVERDNGSGRFWLRGPGGIRVEVRQYG